MTREIKKKKNTNKNEQIRIYISISLETKNSKLTEISNNTGIFHVGEHLTSPDISCNDILIKNQTEMDNKTASKLSSALPPQPPPPPTTTPQ